MYHVVLTCIRRLALHLEHKQKYYQNFAEWVSDHCENFLSIAHAV